MLIIIVDMPLTVKVNNYGSYFDRRTAEFETVQITWVRYHGCNYSGHDTYNASLHCVIIRPLQLLLMLKVLKEVHTNVASANLLHGKLGRPI